MKTTDGFLHISRLKLLGLALCVLGGLFALFFMTAWGESSKDEMYQTYAVLNWGEARLAPLTYLIGWEWLRLTGMKILNLRILSALIAVMAIGCGALYAWRRTRRPLLAAGLFMLGAWLWRMDAFMLYNWDSGSLLWDALALVSIVEYCRRPTCEKSALCGGAIALMTAGRLPSGILLPLYLVIVILPAFMRRKGWHEAMSDALVCCAAFLVVIAAVLLGVYGSIGDYVMNFTQNSVSGHSLEDTGNYRWRLFYFIPSRLILANSIAAVCMVAALVLRRPVWRLLEGKCPAKACKGVLTGTLLILGCVWVFSLLAATCADDYGSTDGMLGGGFVAVAGLILLGAVRNFSHPERPPLKMPSLELWGCAAVLTAMWFGSDGYIERVEAGFSLPVIVAVVWSAGYRGVNRYTVLMCAVLMSGCVIADGIHWWKLSKDCRAWLPVETGLFEGLAVTSDFTAEYREMKPVIKGIRAGKEKYLYLDHRDRWTLLLGNDAGPNPHNYHFSPMKLHSMKEKDLEFLDRIQTVVYTEKVYDSDAAMRMSVDFLRGKGFTEETHCGDVVVLRRAR